MNSFLDNKHKNENDEEYSSNYMTLNETKDLTSEANSSVSTSKKTSEIFNTLDRNNTEKSLSKLNLNQFIRYKLNVNSTLNTLNGTLGSNNGGCTMDSDTRIIRRKDCMKLRKTISARKFIECSLYEEQTVKDVINTAINIGVNYSFEKENKYLEEQLMNDQKIQIANNSLVDKSLNSTLDDSAFNLHNQLENNVLNSNRNIFEIYSSKIESLSQSKEKSVSSSKQRESKKNASKKSFLNKSFRCFSCTRSETSMSINKT